MKYMFKFVLHIEKKDFCNMWINKYVLALITDYGLEMNAIVTICCGNCHYMTFKYPKVLYMKLNS